MGPKGSPNGGLGGTQKHPLATMGYPRAASDAKIISKIKQKCKRNAYESDKKKQTNKEINEQPNQRQTNTQANKQTNRQANAKENKDKRRQTNKQANKKTNKQARPLPVSSAKCFWSLSPCPSDSTRTGPAGCGEAESNYTQILMPVLQDFGHQKGPQNEAQIKQMQHLWCYPIRVPESSCAVLAAAPHQRPKSTQGRPQRHQKSAKMHPNSYRFTYTQTHKHADH